MSITKSISLES